VSTSETQSEIVGFRLSPQQELVLEPGADGTAVQCAAIVDAPSAPQLRAALAQAVQRYEILRTTFVRPVGVRDRQQVIHDDLAAAWRDEPLPADGAPPAGDPETLSELLASEREAAFDIENGPLLRALLLSPRSDAAGGLLVLTAHAAVADPRSLLLLLGELLSAAESSEPIQYADYAEWRHEFQSGEDADATDGRAWWQADAEEWPTAARLALGVPPHSDHVGPRAVQISLEPGRLQSAADAQRVAPSALLEACWHATLARLTGQGEQLVAGWLDGREQPDLDRAIGAYAQPVPIHSSVQDGTSFAEVLDQVRRGRAEAARRQDYASAGDHGALTRAATAGFVHIDLTGAPGPIAATRPPQIVPLLLVSQVDPSGELSAELQFDADALSEADAQALAARLAAVIGSATADAGQIVSRLTILQPSEREQLIAAAAGPWPGADAATPVHHLFERRAGSEAQAPAVADASSELTYSELDAAANRLAHLLRDAGVDRDARVGLCLHRTPGLLEGLLGILKAGGAYVPLNYEHPPARLAHQLSETEARVLVTETALLDRLPPFAGEIVCLDRDRARIDAYPATTTEHTSQPEDLAYVMYTSGSTGLPKGVMVTHGNLANYSVQIAERLEAEGARFGVVSAISTDLGNTCIFPALVGGGCVQLISPDASMDGDALAAEVGDTALDVLKIAPSHLRALLGAGAAALPRRWLVIGGEALSWELVQRIRELAPDCRVLNHYGPTEATIGCCAYEVAEPRADAATVPIGRPLAGARAYVLDRELEPLPAGVPGELCVAGAGIAAGYVGSPPPGDPATAGNSAGPFLADPFSDEPSRMYRTGDRVRRLNDGAIEFLGRIDDQVKIRGFRIEPAEVEAVLGRHPAIRQAAVVPEPDDRGELRLVAYIAAAEDPTVEDLQAFLAESLPEYMVPGTFAQLDSLPFTPSGKIDRQALAALATVQMRRQAQYVAPRDAIETQIAGIWAELLGADQVGVFDDFFALGGHSLLATQAIMRIRREHADIPLRALLAAPTVATLAEVVRGGPIEGGNS
jgi:amino acid adenylation domain-containing protein